MQRAKWSWRCVFVVSSALIFCGVISLHDSYAQNYEAQRKELRKARRSFGGVSDCGESRRAHNEAEAGCREIADRDSLTYRDGSMRIDVLDHSSTPNPQKAFGPRSCSGWVL